MYIITGTGGKVGKALKDRLEKKKITISIKIHFK